MKKLREVLDRLTEKETQKSEILKVCFHGLSKESEEKLKNSGYELYSGKVRDCALKDDFFSMIHSDRLSAFDSHITDVPFKGLLLSKINQFWLEKASCYFPVASFSSHHPRLIKMKSLKVFPIEVIVRGYLAGSMLRAYEGGERNFCGHTLDEGLKPWGSFKEAIVTPSSKAEVGGHDENKSPEELIASGACTKEEWAQMENLALGIYGLGKKVYKDRGWILVDTKYEFGKDENGKIFLVDELHTPDSSRLWVEKSYETRLKEGKIPEMLDKEIIRRSLMAKGFSGKGKVPEVSLKEKVSLAKVYLEVAEKLYGEPLLVDLSGEEDLLRAILS